MPGRTIRVCPPRDFDFSDLGSNDEQTITIAERLDASQFDELDLMVRVHTAATIASAITVQVVSDGFTTDDPATEFFSDPIGSVSLNGNQNAGTLSISNISSKLGAMVAVQVKGTQAGSPATNSARLSIDLAMKTS